MPSVRRAAVAGSWYPGNPLRLVAELDNHLARAEVEPLPPVRALVVPHAGLMYSGGVAAYAFKAALGRRVDAIVLVGPSHFVPFAGVSIWPDGAWDSPLGIVTIERDLAAAIQSGFREVIVLPAAHAREHSLEMQLPFIVHLMPSVPIVPMVMGYQTRATAFGLGKAIAHAVAAYGRDCLLIASSDLSHYEPAEVAARLDAVVLDRLDALDPEGLMDALESEPRHACGGGPMVAVIDAARRAGASSARVLRYADSGDVSGDKSSVVGYAAAAAW